MVETNLDFFETVENKLRITIPQTIKSHLKYPKKDNFNEVAKLNYDTISNIQVFARDKLHQILKPSRIPQYYGPYFQRKPSLFVFTLGESIILNEIMQICKVIQSSKARRSGIDNHIQAICIENLSSDTNEKDLEELVKLFGPIRKISLHKYKDMGTCEYFAYITFKFCNDAVKAIEKLHRHGHNHMILHVDWA